MNRKIVCPGSEVQCGPNTGKIVAVTLREGFVGYQVAWWDGQVRRMDNFSECEVVATKNTKYMTLSDC